MKALLLRVKNVANDRATRILFYDQTLKKGYASLASFSKLFVLRRTLVTLVAYPLSILCWIFLIVLNLFTPVRIYRFERPQRPGFASVYIEQLEPLCRELQATGHKGFLIFIDASQTTNLELLKLYATHFNLYLDDRVAFVRTIFALIPKIGFASTFAKHSHYNPNWELASAINLKTKGETEMPKVISQLGLEPFKFMLLTYRSLLYDSKHHKDSFADLNRSTDLSKAEDAIRLINERGLKIVRIGVDTDELTDSYKCLPIIDLSGEFRTDAQDLWLAKNCLFLWSMGSVGTWHFTHKFGRPSLVTDSYGFHRGNQATLFSLQLVWDKKLNKMLTLKEMILLKGVLGRVHEMNYRNLLFIENTSEELCAAVEEILDFKTSVEQSSFSESVLLEKYDQIHRDLGGIKRQNFHSRPCNWFLKNHHKVLF